jgi:hypothetical protein
MSAINKLLRSIYISTCGVNEDDIGLTVNTAYENARFPSRIYFGIIDQRTDGKFADTSHYRNVKKVNISYEFPLGLGLGRLNALMLHENQDYCLQIDAHTIFEKNWDVNLLREYSKLQSMYGDVAISQRTKWFERDANGVIIFHDTNGDRLAIDETSKEYGMQGNSAGTLGVGYIEHYLASGHFVFSRMEFFNQLLPDPRIAFYGEEHILALRACTRGWRIFSIDDNFFYHLGKQSEPDNRNASDWKKIFTESLTDQKPFVNFDDKIYDVNTIVKQVLDGDIIGYWGAPTKEAYEIYIQNLGFDYRSEKPIIPSDDDVNSQ